ncbi:unnamed protein product [Prorocentrum cordatum]|uniref:Uncharacterized protein n=1 Tax=Prorocentrum cordatum TaxID=2364126 RepID=A0ABN9TH83_9DINO|nr:unnamed protein product [Polarella glacialis]
MDHATPDCPTPRPPRPASKGFKGRGKTSKAQSRPRRLGFWAMNTLARVMLDMFNQKDAQDQDLATEKFQEPAEYDIMMASAESDPILPNVPEVDAMISSAIALATPAVAGRGWLETIAAELEKHGLRHIIVEASQKFKGLGGARREAKRKWIIPIGIGTTHVLQEYIEIPGDMIGLTRKKNLADWKTNLYLREDGQWVDFQELGVHDKELAKLPGGHAGIDIFDYDLESYEAEPLLEKSRINVENVEQEAFLVAETLQESKPDFTVKDDADWWVQEAMKNGSKGIFKKGTLKRIDKIMKEYAVIFDVLRDNNETFLWELFAEEARFTHIASRGGHENATPSDLSNGVNFNDPQTRSDFLFLIRTFKPWMVPVAFPCTTHTNMQELQRAQGMGDRVDDLIQELRPLIEFSAEVLKLQAEGGRIGIGENPLTL